MCYHVGKRDCSLSGCTGAHFIYIPLEGPAWGGEPLPAAPATPWFLTELKCLCLFMETNTMAQDNISIIPVRLRSIRLRRTEQSWQRRSLCVWLVSWLLQKEMCCVVAVAQTHLLRFLAYPTSIGSHPERDFFIHSSVLCAPYAGESTHIRFHT